MRKSAKSFLAIGLASTVASCGLGSFEGNEKYQAVPIEKASGGEPISGCDLDEARRQLRERVVDGKDFWGRVLAANNNDRHLMYIVEDNKFGIANPIVLICDEEITAYAGQTYGLKATDNNNFDPIALIKPEDTTAQDLMTAQDNFEDLAIRSTKLHFEREAAKDVLKDDVLGVKSGDLATYFEDDSRDIYGSALDIDLVDALESPYSAPLVPPNTESITQDMIRS